MDLYDSLIGRLRRTRTQEARTLLARVLFNRGVALRELDRPADALASVDELIALCGDRDDLEGRTYLAKALLSRGFLLAAMGDLDGADMASEEAFDRFGDATDPALRSLAAVGLLQEGARRAEAGRRDEALAITNRLVTRFEAETDWVVLQVVADAIYNRAKTLGEAGQHASSIKEYERVVDIFGVAPEAAEVVARALVNEGVQWERLAKYEKAIAVYRRVSDRHLAASEPLLRAQVAKALFNEGNAHMQLGHFEDALAAYDRAIDGFRDARVATQDVTSALTNKAIMLCKLGRAAEAMDACRAVRERVADPPDDVARACVDIVSRVEQDCGEPEA